MRIYGRFRKIIAVYFEYGRELGPKPFFRVEKYNGEFILECPYCMAIITSAKRLKKEHNPEKHGMLEHEKRDRGVSNPP